MHAAGPAKVVIVVLGLVALVSAGCKSSGGDNSSPSTGTFPSTTTSTAPVAVNGAVVTDDGPACAPEVLTPIVAAAHAGATITEVTCDSIFAVTTVHKAADIPGDGVAMFRLANNAWTLVAAGEIAPDPTRLIPDNFSTQVFQLWKAKYAAVHAPPTTAGRNTPTVPANIDVTDCHLQGDIRVCPTTTQAPPPTTPPPTLPDGSPAPTTPPPTSQFCRYNYNDPACKADPLYPG